MRRTVIVGAVIAVCFAASFLAKTALRGPAPSAAPEGPGAAPERIVSLAPSITEILHFLGVFDRVVGVTRYCYFPPEARAVAEVGGYYDPNYEAIVALRPDLVVMLKEHLVAQETLSRFGIDVAVVDNQTIDGILAAIETVGETCGVPPAAEAIVGDIRARIRRIRQRTGGLTPPRVLVSIGRIMGSGALEDVYIAGKDGFYNEMIGMAGGVNAYGGSVAFPLVSGEGIIGMNPEVIIDMVPDLEAQGLDRERIQAEWSAVGQVDAVRSGRVHLFEEGYAVVPGPRFISILEKMARVLHPGLDWDGPPPADPASPAGRAAAGD